MQYELIPEEFGGETMVVEVSAKTGQNLDKLVETILLQAEVLELKANPNRVASGVVVEAKLDQGKGVTTTILIQKGTLKVGDIVVAGAAYGKVRTIVDDKGANIKDAIPGMPVVILGLSLAPDAGDVFSVVENEKTARDIAEYRERRTREKNVDLPLARWIICSVKLQVLTQKNFQWSLRLTCRDRWKRLLALSRNIRGMKSPCAFCIAEWAQLPNPTSRLQKLQAQ